MTNTSATEQSSAASAEPQSIITHTATREDLTAAFAMCIAPPISATAGAEREYFVATVLDKELKRQVTVDGVDYTVAIDPEGIRLTGKGKRKPEIELRWRDLLSGEAAMAVALNASLAQRQTATKPQTEQSPDPTGKRPPTKRARWQPATRSATGSPVPPEAGSHPGTAGGDHRPKK